MRQSLSEIYESVESKNESLSYEDYIIVLDALEWKDKSGVLTESINKEDDLVYWVEAVRSNQGNLNEWSIEDFTNLVVSTKEKAVATGQAALKAATDMVDKFKQTYAVTYDAFLQLGIELKLGMNEVFNTLREKGLWEAIKAMKNVAMVGIGNLYSLYTSAYQETSDIVFGAIDKTKVGELLGKGADKIQQLVKENPKLKYVLGPIIAYTLYYIWTKMVFKGNFIYDFDWSVNVKAFLGDFDVVEIFSGQGGVELLSWFALGLSGMFPSAAWLDGELESLFGGWGNHALAILATIMIFINDKYPKMLDRPIIQTIKAKLCRRDQQMSMKKQAMDTLRKIGEDKGIYKACNGPKCGA